LSRDLDPRSGYTSVPHHHPIDFLANWSEAGLGTL